MARAALPTHCQWRARAFPSSLVAIKKNSLSEWRPKLNANNSNASTTPRARFNAHCFLRFSKCVRAHAEMRRHAALPRFLKSRAPPLRVRASPPARASLMLQTPPPLSADISMRVLYPASVPLCLLPYPLPPAPLMFRQVALSSRTSIPLPRRLAHPAPPSPPHPPPPHPPPPPLTALYIRAPSTSSSRPLHFRTSPPTSLALPKPPEVLVTDYNNSLVFVTRRSYQVIVKVT
jgi:hypothetical protein